MRDEVTELASSGLEVSSLDITTREKSRNKNQDKGKGGGSLTTRIIRNQRKGWHTA